MCVNVAGEKNFEGDVRERVGSGLLLPCSAATGRVSCLLKNTRMEEWSCTCCVDLSALSYLLVSATIWGKLGPLTDVQASIYVPSVGMMTIAMLQRNL